MEYSMLDTFRHNLYHDCFTRAADALFDLADALVSDTTTRSLVELSQAASFRRQWPSLYAALADGVIDRSRLRRLFGAMLPRRVVGSRLVLGLDTSSIARPDARTSPDRTLVYQSNLPGSQTPVVAGWQFSTLVVLPETVSSWTYILDNQRVTSSDTATTTGVSQLQELLPQLVACWGRPLLLLDRRYSNAVWISASAKLPTDQLIRARGDQVLYRPAPLHSGKTGRPRKDGARFKGTDATTHTTPDQHWSGHDALGKPVQVSVWHGLHLRKARDVTLSVVRIVRPQAPDSKRDRREMWLWWYGEQCPPLPDLPGVYARRFGQEHGYRFDKQDLLWDTARLRTPEQMQRWTDVVAAVHNQLVLASGQATAVRRRWERKLAPATPRQVRRAMGQIIAQLGTPARLPQPRGKAPGRAAGTTVKPAPRHEVVRKTAPKAKSPSKRC